MDRIYYADAVYRIVFGSELHPYHKDLRCWKFWEKITSEQRVQKDSRKGISPIIMRFGTAMIPVHSPLVTCLGNTIGGGMVLETVFGVPGVGKYIVDSIAQRNLSIRSRRRIDHCDRIDTYQSFSRCQLCFDRSAFEDDDHIRRKNEEKKDEKDKCSSVGGMRDVENENSCNGENRKEKCEKKETGEIDADA